MKPGKELDHLIAEKVLGWKKIPERTHECNWIWDRNEGCTASRGQITPRFSTDIGDAWQVWEKLCESARPIIFRDAVYLSDYEFREGLLTDAESVAHGICLAALRNVEGRTP